MAIINKTGIGTGNTIQAEHVTRIIDALSGVATTTTVIASGSFTGSLIGEVTLNSATINGTLEQGLTVSATGLRAHAEGRSSIATGDYSHVEGYINTASGNYSHAEGEQTEAAGFGSHAEGALTTTIQRFSHAEGYGSTASGSWSHAEGEYTTAFGTGSHSEGLRTYASGSYSNAKGKDTLASGRYSLAIGQFSTASADQSFASGYDTLATANGAHAQGQYTTASGNYSHAEGRESHASGFGSHAEGYQTSASGDFSYASGADSIARGSYSRAEGVGTIASGSGQHVTGKYNKQGSDVSLFIIGDGTSDGARSDVFKAKTGAIEITGSLSILKGGGALNLVGTDHTYMQMYPDGFAAGRKAYIGYASAPDNDLTIANEFAVSQSGIRFKIAGGTVLYMSGSDGSVGIGTDTPTKLLHVDGEARIGSIPFTGNSRQPLYYESDGSLVANSSDNRFKTNISTLTGSLDKVNNLRGVTFNWVNQPSGSRSVGFIAQEVESVIPELVFTDQNNPEQYKGVYYSEMTALLVEAIKTLSAENESLKSELQTIKTHLGL